MKKLLIFSATLLLMGACSGNSGKSDQDLAALQKQHDDSIAAVAEAEAAAQALADSIRQDSIMKVEKFIAAIPTFKEIDNAIGDYEKLFRSKGFTITYGTGEVWDPDLTSTVKTKTIIANLHLDENHSCTFREFLGFDSGCGWKMTITGAPEKLQQITTAAKAYLNKMKRQNPGDWYFEDASVKQSDNTVTYLFPMGD